MLVQIYEVQTPEEAVALARLGVGLEAASPFNGALSGGLIADYCYRGSHGFG